MPEEETSAWPDGAELAAALADWRGWPMLTPALRKQLQSLDRPDQLALLADLEDGGGDIFLYADTAGAIREASAWPGANSANLREEASEFILPALEKAGLDLVLARIDADKKKNEQAVINRSERRRQKLLARLDADAERLSKMAAKGADAQLLAANLWRWDKSAKMAQVEIPVNGAAQLVHLPNPRLSIVENMEKIFQDARRGKRGLEMVEQRRRELAAAQPMAAEKDKPNPAGNTRARPAPANLPRHTQAFYSSDGYLILRGRNAKGNMAMRRAASGHDIWAHVQEGSGAHVIIKRPHGAHAVPERTLMEAGTLAANKSWLADAATANVMYAESRHVRASRSGPQGKVLIDKLLETRIVPVDHSLDEKLAAWP